MKFKILPNFTRSTLIILIFTLFTSSGFSIILDLPRQCATFQSSILPGETLSLQDGVVIGNFGEEYATSERSWNISGSWTVSTGCEVRACSNVYLGGSCKDLTNTSSGLSGSAGERQLSASCTCERECSCVDIDQHQEKWVCAVAYFHPRGCNQCNSEYIQLANSSDSFPEKWGDSVKSFLIVPGCTLTLYEEEGYEDEAEILEENVVEVDWSGTIGSYSCQCDSQLQLSNVFDDTLNDEENIAPENDNNADEASIPLVAVPDTLEEIVSQIRLHNFTHPGLRAAFDSTLKGRSSRNAYILTIGSSGAGKSSLINHLLASSNVTFVGGDQSTTTKIHEFRIPVPLNQLGLTNTELRIIDTPGLGDTGGLEQDALFLSTLDEYLSGHEDLKSRIPNLVLILHHFTDNRFGGQGAKFVSMIRGLDYFRRRITDENFSNVLFVFSHLCSASKQLEQNPSPRLLMFREVIEKFTMFPRPIQTAVVENMGKENGLVMVNGNYKLPNNELFPRNLLDRFHSITGKGGDKLGQAVITTALNQASYQKHTISETRYPLVNRHHNKIPKYLDILTSALISISSSQVSRKLLQAFETMNDTLKSEYPESLDYLQKFLNIRNIRTLADIPQTTTFVVELFLQLEKNPAHVYLLEKGLGLKAPAFPQNILAGYSYSILKDTPLPKSPYQLDQPQLSNIGFMLPKNIECTKHVNGPFSVLKIDDRKEDYMRARIQRFGYNMSIVSDVNIFTGLRRKFSIGYNSKDVSCSNNKTCSFVASMYFDYFKLDLQSDAKCSPEFLERVGNLQAFNKTDYENVESWRSFFDEYGTHVVSSAEGGGRIDIQIETPFPSPNITLLQNAFKTVEFAEDLSKLISGEKVDPNHVFPENVSYSLSFQGGSASYHTSDLTKLDLEEASDLMKKWKMSLRIRPVIRATRFTSLGDETRRLGQGVSERIQEATIHLLNSTLKYAPPPAPDPTVELERVLKRIEENERPLAEEMRRLKEKAERERHADIAEQMRIEVEAKELEERRRREETEMERLLEVARATFRRERELELERIRDGEREFRRQLEMAEERRRDRERELELIRRFGFITHVLYRRP